MAGASDGGLDARICHVGTACLVLEIAGLRIVTDPVFDPPGSVYGFGFGARSTKLTAPAVDASTLGPVDVVLLSHDHHADNLDRAGRQVVERAGRVLTTPSGARRLGGGATGLRPWQRATLSTPGGRAIEVTATPARHGPPLSRPFVGEVVGFHLRVAGQERGGLYLSGDTVWFGGIAQIGRRLEMGLAVLHLGAAGFSNLGPVRFSAGGADAIKMARALPAPTLLAVHAEGWSHFRESREQTQRILARADLSDRFCWPEPGRWMTLDDRLAMS